MHAPPWEALADFYTICFYLPSLYHLGHVSKTCHPDLDNVISLASSMAHGHLPSVSAIYEQCLS